MYKQRVCLRCEHLFDSTGAGNRICKPCALINKKIHEKRVINVTSLYPELRGPNLVEAFYYHNLGRGILDGT